MVVSCKMILYNARQLTATNQYYIHLGQEVEDSRKSAKWQSRTPEAVNPMTLEKLTGTTWRQFKARTCAR